MLESVHLPITGFSCTVFLAYIRQVKRGLKAGGSPKQCVKSKQSLVSSVRLKHSLWRALATICILGIHSAQLQFSKELGRFEPLGYLTVIT